MTRKRGRPEDPQAGQALLATTASWWVRLQHPQRTAWGTEYVGLSCSLSRTRCSNLSRCSRR